MDKQILLPPWERFGWLPIHPFLPTPVLQTGSQLHQGTIDLQLPGHCYFPEGGVLHQGWESHWCLPWGRNVDSGGRCISDSIAYNIMLLSPWMKLRLLSSHIKAAPLESKMKAFWELKAMLRDNVLGISCGQTSLQENAGILICIEVPSSIISF